MSEERANLGAESEERLPAQKRALPARDRYRRAQPLPEEHGWTATPAGWVRQTGRMGRNRETT